MLVASAGVASAPERLREFSSRRSQPLREFHHAPQLHTRPGMPETNGQQDDLLTRT